MEITNTVITRTARHQTDKGVFRIDYTVTNGKLGRIQLNIFKPSPQEEEQQYIGAVYLDNRTVSCNIPWNGDALHYFETAAGFIGEILESIEEKNEDTPAEEDETNMIMR